MKFNFNKSRSLALDLSNIQVTEVRNNDYVVGFGFKTKKLPAWTKIFNKMEKFKPLKNDLTFKADMTIRDQVTIQRQLTANDGSEGSQTITAGSLNLQLRPTVSYQYNKKVNLQLYFERTIYKTRVSTSYDRATTAFGVKLRFSLS